MDTYKVVIPVRVARLQRPDEKREEPTSEAEISLRVVAYSPEDAADRLTDALSHLLNRGGAE